MQELMLKQLKNYDIPLTIKLQEHPIRYIQQIEKLIPIINNSGYQDLKQLQPEIDKIKTEIEKVKSILHESKVVQKETYTSLKVLLEFLKLQTNNTAIKNLLNFIQDQFPDINWDELRNLLNKNILGFLQYPENQQDIQQTLQKGKVIIKLYKKFFQPQQGIKTDVLQIKRYLNKLKEFALKEDQLNVIQKIMTPKGLSPQERLKRLRYSEEEDEQSDEDQQTPKGILEIETFIALEDKLMEDGLLNTDEDLYTELEHVHNKLIFDALNEALDYSRPYGLGPQPIPWKTQAYCIQRESISKYSEIKEDPIDNIFQKGLKKVTQWAEVQLGIIYKQNSPFPKILHLDQNYLHKIKEERLTRELNVEFVEQQQEWQNYDDYYTEINFELTEFLLDDLINELVREKF